MSVIDASIQSTARSPALEKSIGTVQVMQAAPEMEVLKLNTSLEQERHVMRIIDAAVQGTAGSSCTIR